MILHSRTSLTVNILKLIKVLLRRRPGVLHAVIAPLRPHIVDQPDGEQVQVSQLHADVTAAQEVQRRGHLPAAAGVFFFALALVNRLSPHSCTSSPSTS